MTARDNFFNALCRPCPHPEGTRIQVTGRMLDDPDPIPIGTEGTIVGGNGHQVDVDWDNGRTLMLLVRRDPYRVLPPDERAEGGDDGEPATRT